MEGRCSQKKITLAYPKHRFTPEDLLHFIESTEFTRAWDSAGLDAEDDLESLQICIMAKPGGDREIPGTDGLRIHSHLVGRPKGKKRRVTVYYAHFEEYGIVYLTSLDVDGEVIEFSEGEKIAIRDSMGSVKAELDRRKVIR